MAQDALRTICIAYKDLKPHEGGIEHDEMAEDKINRIVEIENNICIALIGIKDVIRPEVPEAIKKCQRAQVAVRMVTGDQKDTAIAIAKECGILPKDYRHEGEYKDYEICTGPEFAAKVGGIQNPGAGDAEVVANKEEFKLFRKYLKVMA